MKYLLRNTFYYAFALFLLPFLLTGVSVRGGLTTYLFAGFILTLLLFILKPIIGIISFPLNVITLGLFSLLTNTLILYLLTVFVPAVVVNASNFKGISLGIIIIPELVLNIFFTYLVSSVIITLFITFMTWITE